MLRRTSSRSCATSWPATRARPPVGRASVQSMWIVVVLPAPLGPRKPNTSPRATSKLTPRTASTSPKDFTSCSTSIAADMAGTLGRSSTVAVVPLPPGAPRDARVVEQQAGLVVDQDATEVVGGRGVVEAPLRRAAVDPRVALLEALDLEAQRPHVGGGRLRLAAGREREAVHGEGVGQRGGLEVDIEAPRQRRRRVAVDAPAPGAVALEDDRAAAARPLPRDARRAGAPLLVELDRVAHGERLAVLDRGGVPLDAQAGVASLDEHDLEALARVAVSPAGEAGERNRHRLSFSPPPTVFPGAGPTRYRYTSTRSPIRSQR